MQENQKTQQYLEAFMNVNKTHFREKKKQPQDIFKKQQNDHLHSGLCYHSSLSVNSTLMQNDCQQVEGEENYVSKRDFYDKIDLQNGCQQLSASQLELLISQTERHKQNGVLSLNSTIDPKINLFEKQIENLKIENLYQQHDSNLLRQKMAIPHIEFQRNSQISISKQDLNKVRDETKPKKMSKIIPQRRRSSRFEVEQFQNQLQKVIMDKNINKEEEQVKSKWINKQQQSIITQEIESPQKTQFGASSEIDYQQKFDTIQNIQKLIKKEDQLCKTFVTRLGIFQRFLRNMKNLSQEYKFRTMSFQQKQRFNDVSFYQSKKKQVSNVGSFQKIIIRIFQKLFLKVISQIPVFNPLNYAVVSLELLVLATLTISTFINPLSYSFDIKIISLRYHLIFFHLTPTLILLISILFKLNTGFTQENLIVSDRKNIFHNYFSSGELLIDCITAASYLLDENYSIYFFLFVKIYQIQSKYTKIDSQFLLSQRFSFFFQTSRLLFLVILLAHLNGCIFHQVAKNIDESWLTKNNLKETDWYVRYINSVYFSFITMVTVGYGDITPVSLQEKVFVIFMVVYSCGVFGYIVSSIGNIFTERAQIKAKFKSQLMDVMQYMSTRNIEQSVQAQVYKYLDYLDKMDHYNHQKGEQIVLKLSPYLQKQININSYYPFLKKTNCFKFNFKDQMLIRASLKVKELTFGPGQIIFNQNDIDYRLYYILKGDVKLSHNDHQICIKDEKDNCFGISEFFTGEARNIQATSLTVSQILYLELNDFKDILKEDPKEYEKFCSLKDQIIYSKISIDQSCYFCNKFSHLYDQCPYYTQKNQRLLAIERSKLNVDQQRQKIERINKIKFNSFSENQNVRIYLRSVRLNYINNQAIEKDEIIKLVQGNFQIEDDIDFYRYNDGFELKQNQGDEIEEQSHLNIVLISSDKIAEEFYDQEETHDIDEKNEESFRFIGSSKKLIAHQIQGADILTEDQRFNQSSPQNYPNQRSSLIKNTSTFDKQLSSAKELYHLNNKIQRQSSYEQSFRKLSDFSQNYQENYNSNNSNNNNNNNQQLLNQIFNYIQQSTVRIASKNQIEFEDRMLANQFFTIIDFDLMKEYTRYFPKNNFIQMIQNYNKISYKNQKIQPKKVKKCKKRNKSSTQSLSFKKKFQRAITNCNSINNEKKINIPDSHSQVIQTNMKTDLISIQEETQENPSNLNTENKLINQKKFVPRKSIFQKSQQ